MWLCLTILPTIAWSATPLLEWRMDDAGWNGVPTAVTNAAGNRFHGTWVNPDANPPSLAPVLPGQSGTCGYGHFDTTSYIDGGTPDLGLTDQLTVMAWLRWDVQPATGIMKATIVSNNSTTTPGDGQFWLQHSSSNDRYEFVVKTSDGVQTVSANVGPDPVVGQWQHVAGVYDGATLTLYINGVANWPMVHTGRFSYQASYGLRVGRWAHNSESYRAFQGAIDEVRIYNVALSAAEVQQAMSVGRSCGAGFAAHLAPGPKPMLDARMDERLWRGTTELVLDSSGNKFHGVAQNGATPSLDTPALAGTPGTCGYGAFNGTNQYIHFGDRDLQLTEQVTAMAWVRWDIEPRSGNPWASIVTNNRAAQADQAQFWLQHNSNNSRFEFVVHTSAGKKRLLSITQPAQGVWYHVAGVYDGRNALLFVNGELENTLNHSGTFLPHTDYQLTAAGWAHSSQSYRALHGNLDEVRVYRHGLSAAAVARAAAAKHACTHTSLATPPELDIASHTNGVGVLPDGFTLSGVSSDAGNDFVQLLITINDPVLGRTVNRQPVSVHPNGTWTFVVAAALVTPGQTVTVTLTATDAEQISTTKTLQVQVAPKPVALWHLDTPPAWLGATGEVADASGSQGHGRARNGTPNPTTSPALAGENGTCGYGQFNGTDQYLELGNPDLGLSKKLTVMAWVRWAVDPLTGHPRSTMVANNRATESDKGQFWLHHKSDNTGFVFAVQTDLGRQEIRSNTVPQQGVWYHVAGVFDGSWLRIFVNGVEERSIAHGGQFTYDPEARLTIGRSAYSGNAYRAFHGSIDEVQLFREVLSAAQITAVANARHACTPDAASVPPILTVASHHDGDGVTPSGFTLTGLVGDRGAPVRTFVDLDDPVLGRTVNRREASVDANGQWTLVVRAQEVTPDQSITVTVRAIDGSAQETRLTLRLSVAPLPYAVWHFEPAQQWQGTPGEVAEASGRGYAGRAIYGTHALYDTPALGDSSAGTCGYATFDGRYQYIDLPARNLSLTNQVTVMAWARWDIDPATGNSRATLVSESASTAGNTGQFWLRHNANNSRFTFAVHTSAGFLEVSSTTPPQVGRWYHLAGVYDGSRIRIYVNGVAEGDQAHSGAFTYNAAEQLRFARSAYSSANYQAFAGSLDEVQVYQTALNPSAIRAVAYERRACPAAPALTLTLDAASLEAEVRDNGLVLSGSVSGGYALSDVQVNLFTAGNGQVLGRYTTGLTLEGRWAVLIDGGLLTPGQAVNIEVIASDALGNRQRRFFMLNVAPFDRQSYQLINRITFGATPDLMAEVATLGRAEFLRQQLDPDSIDDGVFEATMAGVEPATIEELQMYLLQHAIQSRRQLREVMTWFWENHFNTFFQKHRSVAYELAEHRAFRTQALGRFRTLLEISAKSPAMLVYLDNAVSQKNTPNENYARELLELHTLGVHGGYTQTDVEQVAKAFTGWRVKNGAFFFDATRHNTTPKTVLGQAIPGGGMAEGEAILELLANHPATARFLCTKLSALLVSDTPPASLVDRCATTFLQTAAASDQMAQVVQLIVTSPEFGAAAQYRSKVKTPLEFVVGVVRNLQATVPGADLPGILQGMGQSLFKNPVPTGYAETGTYWLNTYQLAERIKFVNRIALNSPTGTQTSIDPMAFFTAHGHDTAEGIVHFLCTLVFGDDYTQLEWTIARDVLTDNGTTVFDIHALEANWKLRQLIGTVLSFPGYLYQ